MIKAKPNFNSSLCLLSREEKHKQSRTEESQVLQGGGGNRCTPRQSSHRRQRTWSRYFNGGLLCNTKQINISLIKAERAKNTFFFSSVCLKIKMLSVTFFKIVKCNFLSVAFVSLLGSSAIFALCCQISPKSNPHKAHLSGSVN